MKKIMMLLAMAAGLAVFADEQQDTILSFSTTGPDTYADGKRVADNECYALVWVKTGESFAGFTAQGGLEDGVNNELVYVIAAAKDGRLGNQTFIVSAADMAGKYAGSTRANFSLYLLDTRDGNGVPAVPVNNAVGRINSYGLCAGSSVQADYVLNEAVLDSEFGTTGDTYAGGNLGVLNGERYMIVAYPESEGHFGGFTWDCKTVRATDRIVGVFATAQNGGCPSKKLEVSAIEGYNYQIVVLDTRMPDGSLSPVTDDEKTFKLVSGWGEFLCDANGVKTGILWHEVKIDETGVYDITKEGPVFDYDPTANLAPGYAATFDVLNCGAWTVFPLPKAYVDIHDEKITLENGKTYDHLGKTGCPAGAFDLEIAYKFSAFASDEERDIVTNGLAGRKAWKIIDEVVRNEIYPEDPEKAAVFNKWYFACVPFFQWNADFEVSFDAPIKAGSVLLAGSYEQATDYVDFKWAGGCPAKDMTAGEVFRLLRDNDEKGVSVNYQEICTRVQDFLCGVKNVAGEENYGKTMTVRLCIYQNTGAGTEHETENRIVIGTYRYTFCGPLAITYVKNAEGDVPDGDWEVPPATNLVTDGRSLVRLALPTYDKASNTNIAFVGWTNGVDETIYTMVPSNTWGAITLGSVWKKAKTVSITPVEGQSKVAEIKVTEEWAKEKLGLDDEVVENPEELSKELDKEAPNGKPVWQNYLLGLDPKDPDAKLKVASTEGAQEDKAIVVSTVEVAPPDTGFRVEYSLDKLKDDVTQDKDKEVDRKDTKDLSIDLEPQSGDTPTGYYKMNVIVTPENSDGEPDVANQVKIPADNDIGVIRIESEEKLLPVAVPWLSLTDGTAVVPEEIVDPRTLSEGDLLYVYKMNGEEESDVYESWHIENGKWKKVEKTFKLMTVGEAQPVAVEKAEDRENAVKCGRGVWLKRSNPTKPIYLVGQYDKTADVTVKIESEAGKAKYNLIAPTGISETDLNEVIKEEVGATDKLMTVENGAPVYYSFHDGRWGYNKQEVYTRANGRQGIRIRRVEDAKVSAGIGLWYISEGGTPTINWKNGQKKED